MKERDPAEQKGKEQRHGATDGEGGGRAESVPGSSRRAFFNWIWTGLGIVALAELAWVAASFLRPRALTRKAGHVGAAVIEAGPVERFPPGSVTAFPRGKFYLARLEDGGFLALSRTCTHLGCTVPWSPEKKQFACPCHGSIFDIRGEVVHAPAARPLDVYRVFIENRNVKIDTGKRIRRSAFRPEQVVYAERT